MAELDDVVATTLDDVLGSGHGYGSAKLFHNEVNRTHSVENNDKETTR